MTGIVMNIKSLLVFSLLGGAFATQAESLSEYKFKEAELFSSESKILINREVPLGALTFANQETNVRTEGYYSEKSVQLNGKAKVRIFDFSRQYSAFHVAQLLEELLEQRGYVIRYRCQEISCGDLIGWRASLSHFIDGVENRQQVIVASKINNNLSASYIVGHITDIDSQPRLAMEVIETASPIKSAPNRALTLNFDVNSAEFTDEQKRQIGSIAEVIKRDSMCNYKITGFADSQGDEASNLILSETRAYNLSKLLIDQYGVPAEIIDVRGVGEAHPLKNNNSVDGRAANRRVELIPVRL